jgi:glycosyltransferase involved in cell wall biosynthesis
MKPLKKILILIEWFTPGYKAGGPIQSCLNIALALQHEYDIYVLTTDTDHGENAPYAGIEANQWQINVQTGLKIFYTRKATISFEQMAACIKEVEPDYIYLNLLFSPYFVIYPLWLKYRNKTTATIVVSPRGTLYDSALAVRWYKKKPLLWLYRRLGIGKQVLFHATNEREKMAIERIFPGSKKVVANNLPSLHQPAFKTLEKKNGMLRCIFIARIVPIKNLLYSIRFLRDCTSHIDFTIVGPVEDGPYWNECREFIRSLSPNIEVRYVGPKRNDELTTLVQQHHLLLLPSKGENFGHAIFDSFLAGRPVLISDQTPWRHLSPGKIGWDLSLDQPAAFTAAIETAALWNQQEFDDFALAAWEYAADFINDPLLTQPYKQLFS